MQAAMTMAHEARHSWAALSVLGDTMQFTRFIVSSERDHEREREALPPLQQRL